MQDSLIPNIVGVAPSGSLAQSVIEFSRELNSYGFELSQSHTLLALEALLAIDLGNKSLFESALRLVFVNSPEERAIFAVVFRGYWHFEDTDGQEEIVDEEITETVPEPNSINSDDDLERILAKFSYEEFWAEQSAHEEDDEFGATAEDDRSDPPRSEPLVQQVEMKRIVRALEKHFAPRKSRRLVPQKRRGSPDFRKMLKKSVRFGGLPIESAWRQKKRLRPRMVMFVDVSRSMASYAKLLLEFTSAVLRHTWHVDVFLFATTMIRMSECQMKDEELDINQIIADCGGGTRIGDNLCAFNQSYDYLLTGNRTVAIILSDGLDGGDGEQLVASMQRLSDRARQVIWLNPLLGLQNYDAATRNILPALDYVDILAPAHELSCLWDLLSILRNEKSVASSANPSTRLVGDINDH